MRLHTGDTACRGALPGFMSQSLAELLKPDSQALGTGHSLLDSIPGTGTGTLLGPTAAKQVGESI